MPTADSQSEPGASVDDPRFARLDPASRAAALDGLARLNAIVPLAARQAALPAPWADLHRRILRVWAATGRPPSAARLRAAATDAEAALARLCADDLVVGDPAALRIDGAYPFSAESTEHAVVLGRSRARAMCAVDALAISPMTGLATRIESRCRVSGEPVRLAQHGTDLRGAPDPGRLRVGIHWQQPGAGSCTAHSLCRDMVFLSAGRADGWRRLAPGQRRLYTLAEAVALGAAFFRPLLA